MICIDWLPTAILHSHYVKESESSIYFQLRNPGAHHAAVHDSFYLLFCFPLCTRHVVHRAQTHTVCTTQIDNNRHQRFVTLLFANL